MGACADHIQVAMRTIRAILATLPLTTVLLALASSPATAGSIPVETCTSSVNYENHSWIFTTNNPTYIESHTVCGEPPAVENPPKLVNLSLGDSLGAGGVPVGAKGTWTFKAPQGTTISDVYGTDYLTKVGGNNGWNVYLSSEDTEEHNQLAQTCATSYLENECRTGGPFDIPGLKAKTVTIGIECDAEEYEQGHYFTTCARGNEFGHAARAEFDNVTVMLNDPTPPNNVSATNTPTGPQHGTIMIDGSATDTIAGLTSLDVIDKNNKIVGGPVTVPGNCDYSQTTPCPTSATNIPMLVNTEELPDGTNELQIVATNAAQDQETSPPFTITVENLPTTGDGGDGSGGGDGTTKGSSSTADAGSGGTISYKETLQSKPSSRDTTSLPALPLKLTKTRIRHHKLLLYGTTPNITSTAVWITLSAHRHSHHPWTVRRKVKLAPHFHYSISLPYAWRNVRATLEILYKGGGTYRLTRIYRILLI